MRQGVRDSCDFHIWWEGLETQPSQGDFVPLLCNSVRRFISVLTVICRFAAMMGFIRLVTVILSVLLAGKGLFMMISRDIVFIIMWIYIYDPWGHAGNFRLHMRLYEVHTTSLHIPAHSSDNLVIFHVLSFCMCYSCIKTHVANIINLSACFTNGAN